MPQPSASKAYLDPRTLAAVSSLELRARLIVEGLMIGMHRSPYRGLSVEFAQHRQYAPGDDVRYLDWKVFARTDKLHLKQYQKETNLDLLILLDASGSMGYSSLPQKWSKYDLGASLAAALAYLALRQQDRVSAMLFGDQLLEQSRMSNAADHWRSILALLGAEGSGPPATLPQTGESGRGTDLARLFERATARLTQRSVVVLISDLLEDPASLEQGMARLFHDRHDLIIFQTLDKAERTFPFRDPTVFAGLENEGSLNLDPAALRSAYLEAFEAHALETTRLARRFHFDKFVLDTSQPLGSTLSRFLARRASAATHGTATGYALAPTAIGGE